MFVWNGTEISTIGELLTGAVEAARDGMATEYLAAYEATNPFARENLGYVFGYSDGDTRKMLHESFQLSHPIFGSNY